MKKLGKQSNSEIFLMIVSVIVSEEAPMGLGKADTRAKLIDQAIHSCGRTEDLIPCEETAGAIEIVGGKPRKRSNGRVDYSLPIKVRHNTQPVAMALIMAKAEHLLPTAGLEQAKLYARSKRLNVPFVFASNGHLFGEHDRLTGFTSKPKPIAEFPSLAERRSHDEEWMG